MHRAVAITALAALMVVSLASPIVKASRPEGDLQVTVTYSGKGKVDDTHEIWIYLFDTPAPSPDAMPLAMDSITTNGGTKEFKVVARIDTPEEMNYYKNGGILHYVLRQLVSGR